MIRNGNEGTIESDAAISLSSPATANGNSGDLAGVTVKGWRNGLLLILPYEGDWADVMQQVHAKLDEAKARSFWRGAQTTLDCGMRPVSGEQLTELADFTRRAFGLVPVAVVATDLVTREAAEKLALTAYEELPVVKKNVPAPEPAQREPEPNRPGYFANNALYVPNTIRSGQRLEHDGHLFVCGDVNAGAEVLAGGDIVVMGTLRGLAHAGCYGDETARIVAGNLRPTQLRIAGKIARSPEEGSKGAATARTPEVARIVGSEIGIFPL